MRQDLLNFINSNLFFVKGERTKLVILYRKFLEVTNNFDLKHYSNFRSELVYLLKKMDLQSEIVKKNNVYYITNLKFGQEPSDEEILAVSQNLQNKI